MVAVVIAVVGGDGGGGSGDGRWGGQFVTCQEFVEVLS